MYQLKTLYISGVYLRTLNFQVSSPLDRIYVQQVLKSVEETILGLSSVSSKLKFHPTELKFGNVGLLGTGCRL